MKKDKKTKINIISKRIFSSFMAGVLMMTMPFSSTYLAAASDEEDIEITEMVTQEDIGDMIIEDDTLSGNCLGGNDNGLSVDNPRLSDDSKNVKWDAVYFGSYWQDDTNKDGQFDGNDDKTPIKWRVIDVDKNAKVLTLLSDEILDCKEYYIRPDDHKDTDSDDVSFDKTKISMWLDNEFTLAAFNDDEKLKLYENKMSNYSNDFYNVEGSDEKTHKVLLADLDILTIGDYGFYETTTDDNLLRSAKATKWAKAKGVYTNEEQKGWWWLGNPGAFGRMAVTVTETGLIDNSGYFTDSKCIGVRPLIQVKYEENDEYIKEADDISIDAEVDLSKTFFGKKLPLSIPVEGIKVSEKEIVLSVGEEKRIETVVYPSDASVKGVIWESENAEVASVKDGIICGKGAGETNVTVSTLDGNFKETIVVKVHPKEITVTFDPLGGKVDKASMVVSYGASYGELPKAMFVGKEFIGWYTEKEGGCEVTKDTVVTSDVDVTLYAHYDYIYIVSKQKLDVSKCFNIPSGSKVKFEGRYIAGTNVKKGAKASVSKRGILKVGKAGTVEVYLLVKNGKKYEKQAGAIPFVVNIVKPNINKKYTATYIGQTIKLSDIIGTESISSNRMEVTIKNGKKEVAALSENNKEIVIKESGSAKAKITITNIQDYAVTYSVNIISKIPKLSSTDINLTLKEGKKVSKKISLKNVKKDSLIEWTIGDKKVADIEISKDKHKATVIAKAPGETTVYVLIDAAMYKAAVKVSAIDGKPNNSNSNYLGDIPMLGEEPVGDKVVIKDYKDDIQVIPDKYNVGARGSLKPVNNEAGKVENIEGININTRSVTSQKTGETQVYREFYFSPNRTNPRGKIPGVVVIRDRDFSDMKLSNTDASKSEFDIKIIFKNCKFATVALTESESRVMFEFDDCTINHISGSNIILNRCSLGNSASDALNPFRNVFLNRSYISNLAVYMEGEDGAYHSDAIQMYGREDSATQTPTVHVHNVEVYNSRIEVPAMHIEGSGAYVNACFMVQLEYANAYNVHFDSCVINGGGYSIYSHAVKRAKEILDLTFDDIRIGGSRSYGALYADTNRSDTKGEFTNISETNALYIASVWKNDAGTHFSVTNDTLSERKLLIVTDKGEYTTTIKPAYKCVKNNGVYSDNYNGEVVTDFSQLPIDIDYVIKDNVSYAVCFDITNEKIAKQIRFVNWTEKPVYMDKAKYNSLIPNKTFELLSGKCSSAKNANMTFTLTSDFVLTIDGEGAMDNFNSTKLAPWHDYMGSIKKVIIHEGVTSIGANAFISATSLGSVDVPDSLTTIGQQAFKECVNLSEITLPKDVTLSMQKNSDLDNVFLGTTTVVKYR